MPLAEVVNLLSSDEEDVLRKRQIKTDVATPSSAHQPTLACPICSATRQFESFEQLEIHICLDHMQWCRFECVLCSFARFPTEYTVQLHFNQVHDGMDPKVVQTFNAPKSEYLRTALQSAMDRLSVASQSRTSATGSSAALYSDRTMPVAATHLTSPSSFYTDSGVGLPSTPYVAPSSHIPQQLQTESFSSLPPFSSTPLAELSNGTMPTLSRVSPPNRKRQSFNLTNTQEQTPQASESLRRTMRSDTRRDTQMLFDEDDKSNVRKSDFNSSAVSRTSPEDYASFSSAILNSGNDIAPQTPSNSTRMETEESSEKDTPSSNKEKRVMCELCQTTTLRCTMAEHVWTHHMDVRRYKCHYCNFTSCSSASVIKQHLAKNHDGLEPQVVDNTLAYKAQFVERSLACGLTTRDTTKHTDENSTRCQLCDNRVMNGSVRTHIATHMDEQQYRCTACGFVAKKRGIVDRHIDLSHSHQSRPVIEDRFAEELFDQLTALSVRAFPTLYGSGQERRTAVQQQQSAAKKTAENSSLCHVCEPPMLQFNNAARRHVLSHSQEKGYECALCGKKFSTSTTMRVHLRDFHPGVDTTELLKDAARLTAHFKELGRRCFPSLVFSKHGGVKQATTTETIPKKKSLSLPCARCNNETRNLQNTTHVYTHLAKDDVTKTRYACAVENCRYVCVNRLPIARHLTACHSIVVGGVNDGNNQIDAAYHQPQHKGKCRSGREGDDSLSSFNLDESIRTIDAAVLESTNHGIVVGRVSVTDGNNQINSYEEYFVDNAEQLRGDFEQMVKECFSQLSE